MKRNILFIGLFGLVLAGCLLSGCSSESPETKERLAALEAEVKSLRSEAGAREKALREELAMIRVNLDGIQSMLEVEKGRTEAKVAPKADPEAATKEDGADLDAQIDTKAKTFVKENLDRLLAITKKLLDKMERELDRQDEKKSETPSGDEI